MFIINVSLKRMTSLLITPVPQSSVPGFAASKVGSPWLDVFVLFYFCFVLFFSICLFIYLIFFMPSRFTAVIASTGKSDI